MRTDPRPHYPAHRRPKGPPIVEPRETQDWWDWTYVCARQLARLPAGDRVWRMVVRTQEDA